MHKSDSRDTCCWHHSIHTHAHTHPYLGSLYSGIYTHLCICIVVSLAALQCICLWWNVGSPRSTAAPRWRVCKFVYDGRVLSSWQPEVQWAHYLVGSLHLMLLYFGFFISAQLKNHDAQMLPWEHMKISWLLVLVSILLLALTIFQCPMLHHKDILSPVMLLSMMGLFFQLRNVSHGVPLIVPLWM